VIGARNGDIKTITKHVEVFKQVFRTRVRFPPPPPNKKGGKMKITPLDIRKQEFRKSFKGYDKNEVDIFLEMLAKEIENVVRDNKRMTDQLKELDSRIEDYKRMEKTLQDTLTSTQKTTDEIRRNARKEAEMILQKAKLQASEIIENAAAKVKDLQSQISALRNQKDGFVIQLRSFLSSQLKMLEEVEIIKVKEKNKKYFSAENEKTEELEKTKKKVQELFKE
jgi:cell division initiation protein